SPDHNPVLAALLTAEEGDIEQDVFETVKAALALEPDSVSEYVMPVGDEPPTDDRAGLQLFQKVQGESGKIRAALQGLVQSHSLKHSQPGGRGRLNGKRLHRLCLGDTHVFQRSSVKPSPNTAIHLLLDKSESMGYPVLDRLGQPLGSRIPIALEATLALALAFEGMAGVNPGITAFPGNQEEGSVYRLLDHGQRIRQRTGAFSLAAEGSTPMTEAVWFGAAALLRCREPRKVLMVMTDGQPDDVVSTLDILQRCRDSGIETVGIGLGIDVSHLFPVALAISDLQALRTQLFELSKALLLVA
ncbi:MAG: VWA domain-containing protein, partial [Nitrosomonadales bacterium]